MNKITLLIICSCAFVASCGQSNQKVKEDKKSNDLTEKIEEVKGMTPETNKEEKNNEWSGRVYRNRFYQFRVELPKGWEYDNGTSKITLARALERSKSAAISVTVKHLPSEAKNPNNIFESNTLIGYKKLFVDMMKMQNINCENLKIEKGYLNNFPAYIISFNTEMKSGTSTYSMHSKQIQCYFKSKIYQVNINIPENMYDSKMETLFERVYNSFNFEIVY